MTEDDLTKTHNRVGGQVVFIFFWIFWIFFLMCIIVGPRGVKKKLAHCSILSVSGARAGDSQTDKQTHRIAYYSLAPASGPG